MPRPFFHCRKCSCCKKAVILNERLILYEMLVILKTPVILNEVKNPCISLKEADQLEARYPSEPLYFSNRADPVPPNHALTDDYDDAAAPPAPAAHDAAGHTETD
ncbi:hypothetical protein BH10ACI4_BH10ACI4_39050 [soil metagenome]